METGRANIKPVTHTQAARLIAELQGQVKELQASLQANTKRLDRCEARLDVLELPKAEPHTDKRGPGKAKKAVAPGELIG